MEFNQIQTSSLDVNGDDRTKNDYNKSDHTIFNNQS